MDVSCKLRDIHAVVNAFDVADQYFRISSDLTPAGDGSAKSAPDEDKVPDCEKPNAADTSIVGQMEQLRAIYGTLNRAIMVNTSPLAGPNSAPQTVTNQSQRPGQKTTGTTLFKIPEKCDTNSVDSQDPGEKDFVSL